MAGKFSFTLQEYKDAARKYRSDFLRLPIIGCEETLKFMTGRPGIRYKESVGTLTAGAQFAPYKPSRKTDANLKLDYRTLETFFGSVVANFEPNSAISTLLGTGATKGDGQKSTPTAREVLGLIAKSLSENLNMAIWKGTRNADGDTTMDLFDGFDTITQKEVTAGTIAAEHGNYLKLDKAITEANAVDVAKRFSSRSIRVCAHRNFSCIARRISWICTTRAICSRTRLFRTTRSTTNPRWRGLMANSLSARCGTSRTRSSCTCHPKSTCFMAMIRWATSKVSMWNALNRLCFLTLPPCSLVCSSRALTSDA